MNDRVGGLPRAAQERIARQRASGTTASLLTASAAAALASAGLAPVGEVFGCLVMNLGFSGAGCGWMSAQAGASRALGSPALRPSILTGAPALVSPVTTSGDGGRYRGFSPYVKAYESAWYEAVGRMLAEARALGAHGVVGVGLGRAPLAGAAFEFTALGTAVRSVDPHRVPYPAAGTTGTLGVWHTDLCAEDSAAAILSGFLPTEIVLGLSVSTKHEDWQLKQQRTSFTNGEVTGMSRLIQAARSESRARLAARATHARAADLVVTGMTLREFETPCGGGEGRDLHAESVMTGTTLLPAPRFRPKAAPSEVLTVLPLADVATHQTRRRR